MKKSDKSDLELHPDQDYVDIGEQIGLWGCKDLACTTTNIGNK